MAGPRGKRGSYLANKLAAGFIKAHYRTFLIIGELIHV
jgi:hypothetical protein